jgi:hypothetical protein
MTQTESIKEKQQLPLANVIHWVAVKDAHPPLDTRKVYLVVDDSGNMYQCTWKGTFWETDIYKDEPKVKYWTIVEPPCV